MKIFRRGQASIEFALILPIFAMLLFTLIYLGFLFIDVVTLDSAAAAAARSAAISTDGEPSDAVKKQIQKTTLFLYWYEMDTASPKIKREEQVTEKVLEDDPMKIGEDGYIFHRHGSSQAERFSQRKQNLANGFAGKVYRREKCAHIQR